MSYTYAYDASACPGSRQSDRRLRVVMVTAEPRGAYHLAPLYIALRSRPDVRFTHLVPYPEPVQGRAWDDVASDAQVLASADRVVIVGGSLSAWTGLVWRQAAALGVEVRYSELAFLSGPQLVYGSPAWPRLLHASAQCSGSMPLVADMFPDASVVVTGAPLLDTDLLPSVPSFSRQASPGAALSRRVLLLSRSDREDQDPGDQLRRLAGLLEAAGFSPTVRCHPREDRTGWVGFELDDSENVIAAARGSFAVCGYPGTALSLVAAAGYPTVALETSDEYASMMPAHQRRVVPSHVVSAVAALSSIRERPVASDADRLAMSGPPGPAADRVVSFWCD